MTSLLAALALATAFQEPEEPRCDLTLIPAQSSQQPGKIFQVALRFQIEPHWHIYWLNAGDSGVPTEVKWTLPPGFKLLGVEWSVPRRVESGGIVSYGFEGEAYQIATIQSPTKAATASVKVSADWLICKEICLDGKGTAVAWIPGKAATPRANPAFQKALASLPKPAAGLKFSATADAKAYRLSVRGAKPAEEAYFFPFAPELADHSAPQPAAVTESLLTLTIPRSRFEKGTARRLRGILKFGNASGNAAAVAVDVPISSSSTTQLNAGRQ